MNGHEWAAIIDQKSEAPAKGQAGAWRETASDACKSSQGQGTAVKGMKMGNEKKTHPNILNIEIHIGYE